MRFGWWFGMVFLLAGCVATPAFMSDQMANDYMEVQRYADPAAAYVGEWTAATGPMLTAIRIFPDGRAIMCASVEYYGEMGGKVYRDKDSAGVIFESGVRYELAGIDSGFLLMRSYGTEYRFYAGQVPERCVAELRDK